MTENCHTSRVKSPITVGRLREILNSIPTAFDNQMVAVLVGNTEIVEIADLAAASYPVLNDLGKLRLAGFSDDSKDYLGRYLILQQYNPLY